MTQHTLTRGKRLKYLSNEYEIVHLNGDESVLLKDCESLTQRVISINDFDEAFWNGEIRFISPNRASQSDIESNIPNPESSKLSLSDYPEAVIKIAKFRFNAVEPLVMLGCRRTDAHYQARFLELQKDAREKGMNISVRSLYRWVRDYEIGQKDIRCLIPNRSRQGGFRKNRVDTRVNEIIETILDVNLAKSPPKPLNMIYLNVIAAIDIENTQQAEINKLPYPSIATVRRRFQARSNIERLTYLKGKKIANMILKQSKKTDYPTAPLDRVEIDHTPVDIIAVDDTSSLPMGRATLTVALDMATRYPLGYYLGFEEPSHYAVMECLYHCINPNIKKKEDLGTNHDWIASGIPNTIIVDRGKEFMGKDLESACLELGISMNIAPARTPQFKGGVERFFRTLNTGYFHTLPGTTFSNVVEKGDYNSLKTAMLSIEEIEKGMLKFILDIYCERQHSGLQGIPARIWEKHLKDSFIPRYPKDMDSLWRALGCVEERVVSKEGIELHGIIYNCDDLVPLRSLTKGEKVKVKFHPGDLSRIAVFDKYENRYIDVPALDREYTNKLSLWKHKVFQKLAKLKGDRANLSNLAKAQQEIDDSVYADKGRKRHQTYRRIARYKGSGNPRSISSEENPLTNATQSGQNNHYDYLNRNDADWEIKPIDTNDSDWGIILPSNN